MRPQMLDLFCKAGGAGAGYHAAGFDVTGVDIQNQPHYPFAFILADALTVDLSGYDAYHASPPCQAYSDLAHRTGREYPKLIDAIRERLVATGKPYIIENVEGAPLRNPVTLCGTMFSGLRVIRHRLFESNMPLAAPLHPNHPLVFTHDKRKAHYGRLNEMTAFVQVTGGGNCSKAAAASAMNISWMTKGELNEAIPPAYTEFLGRQLLTYVR